MSDASPKPLPLPELQELLSRIRQGDTTISLAKISGVWKVSKERVLHEYNVRLSSLEQKNVLGQGLGPFFRCISIERPDYALYRLLQVNPMQSWCNPTRLQEISEKMPGLARKVLEDDRDLIRWGGLAVLAWRK